MKKFFYYLLLAAVSISFYSCSSNNDEPEPIKGEPTDSIADVESNSFFILNRGSSFSSIDGTLSYYNYSVEDFDILKESLTIYKDSNDRSLGASPNDMALYGDNLFILVYESASMEIMNVKTMKKVNHIDFNIGEINGEPTKSQPRHIAINNGKAYITTYDGFLLQFDCETQQMDGFIYLGKEGNNPDGVAVAGEDIYVALSGGLNYEQGLPYDNKVVRLSRSPLQIVETIEVGLNPTDIVTNGTDVFVVCMGDYAPNGVKPMVYQIMGNIATARWAGSLAAIKDRQLYVINAPWDSEDPITYTCYWTDNSADSYSFIEEGEGVDYPSALGIDPVSGNIVIGSATMDGQYPSWAINGYYKMYSGTDGKKLMEGETGIDPYIVTFLPKAE